ncbi:1-acyl-sn-glycerol-3-phosphate acyltransferase [Lachnospiraceae bacterium ZAX-1]
MIRMILSLLFLILFLIFSIPILLVEWLIGKFNKRAADISSLRIVQWAFKGVIWFSGVKLTVIGDENIPQGEAVLYVPNHESYFDIILTYARCKGLTGYVAKDSMAHVPLLSIWMKRLYCLFLNRDNLKEGLKTILLGIDYVKNGISICIFPEGTRNKKHGELLPFKEGSLKIAEKTGCAIVPIAITNSAEILENHLPKIKPCHVIIQYGKPIYPKELEKEQRKFLGGYTRNIIIDMLKTHKEML